MVTEKEYSEQVMELVIGLCLLDEAHKRESADAEGRGRAGLRDPREALVRAMATAKSFAPRSEQRGLTNGGVWDGVAQRVTGTSAQLVNLSRCLDFDKILAAPAKGLVAATASTPENTGSVTPGHSDADDTEAASNKDWG